MPEKYQKIVQDEFTKGAKDMITQVTNNYDSSKKDLESKGCKFNEVDYDAFVEATKGVYDSMKGTTPGIYDTLQKMVQEYRDKNK